MLRAPSFVEQRDASNFCTQVCREHPMKFIEFFCPFHDDVVCAICALRHHASCGVQYIPDCPEVQIYRNSTHYVKLVQLCSDLQADVAASLTTVRNDSKRLDEELSIIEEDINLQLNQVGAYSEEKEIKLIEQASQMKQQDAFVADRTILHLETILLRIKAANRRLKSTDNATCNMFVVGKLLSKEVKELQEAFIERMRRYSPPSYFLDINKCLGDNIKSFAIKRLYDQ